MLSFSIEAIDGAARAGTLHTTHGDVPTPTFLPVATQASVKALDAADVRGAGGRMVLANAYHLYLRPGTGVIEGLGGLHAFMGWDAPILTDSGGFQGFSLERLRRIEENAIVFKSHLDGSLHRFSPEDAVLHQERLGADVIMPLDVCPAHTADRADVEEAMERTSRWAERSLAAHTRSDQALFGIVQGGVFPDLRERSARCLTSLGFPGYAVGGLSVGESKAETLATLAFTTAMLPLDAPRYLMGVGSPEDLLEGVARGVDVFDCVLPTRLARNGALFVREGRLNAEAARLRSEAGPVEDDCDCYTCRGFSAAYLRHLFRARELLAYRLATIHNVRFVTRLLEEARAAVAAGAFEEFKATFLARFVPPDEATRRAQKNLWRVARGKADPSAGSPRG